MHCKTLRDWRNIVQGIRNMAIQMFIPNEKLSRFICDSNVKRVGILTTSESELRGRPGVGHCETQCLGPGETASSSDACWQRVKRTKHGQKVLQQRLYGWMPVVNSGMALCPAYMCGVAFIVVGTYIMWDARALQSTETIVEYTVCTCDMMTSCRTNPPPLRTLPRGTMSRTTFRRKLKCPDV